jgi:CHAD domain-containing protein
MQTPLTPDTSIVEAGRHILAAQLAILLERETALQQAEETAVHEARKAIRRSFTVYRFLTPFFEEDTFDPFRRTLRKLMRRLGRSRDLTVFLKNLTLFQQETPDTSSLQNLIIYWQSQKTAADVELRYYLAKPKRQVFWEKYQDFLNTPGKGVAAPEGLMPLKVKHATPMLITQSVAAVRVYGDYLPGVSPEQLHRLRLQMKGMRYTLEFFEPLLGVEIDEVLSVVKDVLEILGQLNDAHVAIRFLKESPGLETAVYPYLTHKETEITHLMRTLPSLWDCFESIRWRQQLAAALAIL